MCGRTACTLLADDVCRACSYKKKRRGASKWTVPEWIECPSGRTYHPSPNVAPTSHTPVLIAKRQSAAADANGEDEDDCNRSTSVKLERVVQPMYWSLIPSWHKGQPNELGLSTNNARYESITEKPLFNVPLKKGQRCVVLSDGYYEWKVEEKKPKKSGSNKQPYFIYFPQPDDSVLPGDPSWKEKLGERAWTSKDGWEGPRLLTMAGVYDVWKDPKEDTEMYSYAVVTLDASKTMSFIHERMPAILDGEDAVNGWLDYETVPLEEALKLIVPVVKLAYHPVSKTVGNSRNKSPSCVEPVDPEAETKADMKSRNLMESWLKTPPSSKKKSDAGTKPSTSSTAKRKFSDSSE